MYVFSKLISLSTMTFCAFLMIVYLLHAYDYCPDDPMVCLCLAIASVGRAMQRQSDNRQHLVTQGMAFLSKYRELRKEEDNAIGEVEFNFGRTFHQLGKYTKSSLLRIC